MQEATPNERTGDFRLGDTCSVAQALPESHYLHSQISAYTSTMDTGYSGLNRGSSVHSAIVTLN